MQFYLVYHHGNSHHYGTLDDVKAYVRELSGVTERTGVTVDLVEVATDKANLLRLLNEEGGTHSGALRSWVGTPRGGLKEVPAGSIE